VTLDAIGYNQIEALQAGREQSIVIYVPNEPVQLKTNGFAVDTIRLADYMQLVGNGLITNETTMREKPDLVRRMVQATLKGIQDALANPTEAYDISTKYIEGLRPEDTAVQKQILAASMELWKSPKLGASEPKAWENMQSILLKMELIKTPLDLSKVYSNEFLP
jgi:NitT/TauT family transport system substrate-binding protein